MRKYCLPSSLLTLTVLLDMLSFIESPQFDEGVCTCLSLLFAVALTLRASALPMGGRQVWSWTVEPHTPQQFQCMTVMSFNKVSVTHLFIIYHTLLDTVVLFNSGYID